MLRPTTSEPRRWRRSPCSSTWPPVSVSRCWARSPPSGPNDRPSRPAQPSPSSVCSCFGSPCLSRPATSTSLSPSSRTATAETDPPNPRRILTVLAKDPSLVPQGSGQLDVDHEGAVVADGEMDDVAAGDGQAGDGDMVELAVRLPYGEGGAAVDDPEPVGLEDRPRLDQREIEIAEHDPRGRTPVERREDDRQL